MTETTFDPSLSPLDLTLRAMAVELEYRDAKADQDEFTNTIGKEVDDEN